MGDGYEIRRKLLNVSREVTEGELEELKSLCTQIGDGIREKITSTSGLFKEIQHHFETVEDASQYIAKLLMDIGRKDLSSRLRGIEVNGRFAAGDLSVLCERACS